MSAAGDLVRVKSRELVLLAARTGPSGGDHIRVSNVSSETVGFKVKTTKPQRYIVRPNAGWIFAHESKEIIVYVQERSESPEPGDSPDRFQLCVARAENGLPDRISPSDFWKEYERDPTVARIRLKVKYTTFPRQRGDDSEAAPPAEMPETDELLKEGKLQDAVQKVCELQTQLDEKNSEISRLKTELAETKARTATVLENAPAAPLAANKLVSDPFGGISIVSAGILFVIFLLLIKFLT